MKVRLLAALAVILVVLSLAGPAGATPSGLNNQAFANANGPHPAKTGTAFALAMVTRNGVTAQNVATAQSHDCQGCIAAAVAFQVDLLSQARYLVLTNTATATNTDCTSCTAVAVADQWVVDDVGQPIALTPAGQAALAQVQAQLAALSFSSQFLAVTTALADQVDAILSQDVVVVPGSLPAALVAPDGTSGGITITHYAQVQASP